MAEITFGSIGSASVASGVVTEQEVISLAGATITGKRMDVAQLPHYFFWVSAAAAGITVTPQFAVRDIGIAGLPDWKDLAPPIALAPNVPSVLEFRFPARYIRLSFAGGAPLAPVGVEYIMAAASGV
jgi:hypothetical protein